MLPDNLKALNYHEWSQEEWEDYNVRVCIPDDEAKKQFYRQVIFDHFEHHNDHYPEFNVDDYDYEIKKLSVSYVRDNIGFFRGESLADIWVLQFDQFEAKDFSYSIYQSMAKDKTPPFPTVVIDSAKRIDSDWRVYGRPLHLIEGTHRTSYLLRMAQRGIISWKSEHDFVYLTPKIA
ncbi:MAG: hypothetical protein KZQ91_20720 [Candidatus Thiodiazotropha sp. (ex Lucinoma borealis)]|nr:hypothetical protein [Candidatus Thiodiazotropha sp. (ex Lucinoma borealis)]